MYDDEVEISGFKLVMGILVIIALIAAVVFWQVKRQQNIDRKTQELERILDGQAEIPGSGYGG